MTRSVAARIVLAAYMALWTPAWCCCALRMGIGHVTGAGGAACGADRCCAKAVAVQVSCCTAGADAPLGPAAPCSCHETGNDRLRFDTSVRAELPMPAIGAALPVPAIVALPAPCAEPVRPARVRLERPPPGSLLALHCLLIV